MKARYLFALAALGGMGTSANAAVTISAVDGAAVYAGPAPTYDFDPDGTALVSGGYVGAVSQSGVRARPLGSTGNFWSVGPDDGQPNTLDLSSILGIASLSFIWGSVDDYNVLEVLRRDGTVMDTFTGDEIVTPADGNQTDPGHNPIVTLTFSGIDQGDVGWLRLNTDPSQNAFETDNFAIQAVPEPGTWLLLLLGFGLVGGAMRASKKRETAPRVRYAF